KTARAMSAAWTSTDATAPLVVLTGSDGLATRAVAATACASIALDLYAVHAMDIPSGSDGVTFQRLWERNAALAPAALLVALHQPDGVPRSVLALAETLQGRLVLAARQPLQIAGRAAVRLEVPTPTVAERHDLWQNALGPTATRSLNGELSAVA